MRSDIGLDGLRIDMDELDECEDIRPIRYRESDPLFVLPDEPVKELPKPTNEAIKAELIAAKAKGKYILIDTVLDML